MSVSTASTCAVVEVERDVDPGSAPRDGVGATTISVPGVVTLVLWTGCLLVGAAGWLLHYARPMPALPTPVPLQAELLNVELTSDPLPPIDAAPLPPAAELAPPPAMELPPLPAVPITAVAEVSPAVAFPVPVEGPVRIVPAVQASPARAVETPVVAAVAPAPVQPLTYGVGEGRQPAPDYPRLARRDGQEGTVQVRFSVGDDGRVVTAETALASPWPLLNQAAVTVVRERWRFRPGPSRLYEVAIRFELRK